MSFGVKIHLTAVWNHEIFEEDIRVVQASLSALGHEVSYTPYQFVADALNIVYGAITDTADELRRQAPRIIIRNLEHITPNGQCMFPRYIEALSSFPVWDYCAQNLPRLADAGVAVADYVPVCHAPLLENIPENVVQDIDVYFYGNVSPRRERVLAQLRKRGLHVVVSDLGTSQVFGEERNALIARAKVVLNLGLHDFQQRVFEIVRVGYLLANGKAVVGEIDENTDIEDDIRGAVVGGTLDNLAELAEQLVHDDQRRRQLEHNARAIFRQRDGRRLIGEALQRYLNDNIPTRALVRPRQLNLESGGLGSWRYDFINTNRNPNYRADWLMEIEQPLPFGTNISTWRWGEITIEENMFDHIRAEHVFERIDDLPMALTNCLRLLSVGGTLVLKVPYDLGHSAWQNPRNKRGFNEHSFQFPKDVCWELGWHDAYFESVGLTYFFKERGSLLMNHHKDDPNALQHEPRAYEAMEITLIKRARIWDRQMYFEYGAYYSDKSILDD